VEEAKKELGNNILASAFKNKQLLQPSSSTVGQITTMLYARARMYGSEIELQDTTQHRELVTIGILAMDSENIRVDIESEHVLYEALLAKGDELTCASKPDDDEVFKIIYRSLDSFIPADATKGFVAEDALGWHIIRTVLRNNEATLETIFQPLAVTSIPPGIKKLSVTTKFCKPNAFPEMLFDEDSAEYSYLWTHINVRAGPDLALLVSDDECDEARLVVIQSKAQSGKTFSLPNALRSINPGLMYTSKAQRKSLQNDDSVTNKSYAAAERESWGMFLEAHECLKKVWIRCVFSVAPYPRALVKKVNIYNKNNPKSPIILLQSNAACFGNAIHTKLHSQCVGTVKNARNPDFGITFDGMKVIVDYSILHL
jgi:hypothetical protein